MRPVAVVLALVFSVFTLQAQTTLQADPPSRDWQASWITHPTAPLREPIVLHFRRTLTLAAVPASYIARVSADNRFILYVNGKRAGDGPARGDLTHWRYGKFDLAPLLKPGENLITATVWNWGVYAAVAQFTDRTAFLLESEAKGDASISTGVSKSGGWMVEVEPAIGRGAARPSASRTTWPPDRAKKSTPPSTTGTGSRPRLSVGHGFRLPRPCATASMACEQGALRR